MESSTRARPDDRLIRCSSDLDSPNDDVRRRESSVRIGALTVFQKVAYESLVELE